jgi:CheY-like chemotaxis protein
MAATRAIRRDAPLNRDTPILAVSAGVLDSDVEACRAAGMVDHVPKPIDARELIAKVARFCRPHDGAEGIRRP